MRIFWSDDDLNYLINNFPNNFTSDIAKVLNRSEKSITTKANKLGLKKTKNHISLCIGIRNKLVGHEWTETELIDIAKKYKSRSEFQKSNSAAYSAAKKLEMLDTICSHMINKSFSIPQLILKDIISKIFKTDINYNDRKTLKPYEIDVYLPKFKLGFEYNGKGWHTKNENDTLKLKIANERNITLVTISENSRNYILDIKSQLIDKLGLLNQFIKIDKKTIFDIDVKNPYSEIYDINDLIKICHNYTSFKDFYSKEKSTYVKISKLNLINKCTSHMCCHRKKRNLEEVKDIVSKYEILLDFIKKESGTYQFIKKNNLEYLISHLKRT
jgi:hypothetical protein